MQETCAPPRERGGGGVSCPKSKYEGNRGTTRNLQNAACESVMIPLEVEGRRNSSRISRATGDNMGTPAGPHTSRSTHIIHLRNLDIYMYVPRYCGRYVSQLRMAMCKRKPDKNFASVEEMISTFFHPPGGAKGYLARVSRGTAEREQSVGCVTFRHASCLIYSRTALGMTVLYSHSLVGRTCHGFVVGR